MFQLNECVNLKTSAGCLLYLLLAPKPYMVDFPQDLGTLWLL